MRLFGEIVAALTIGAMLLALIGFGSNSSDRSAASTSTASASASASANANANANALGELRCEGNGAIVIKVGGRDYAVNGMAGSRYPPLQSVWNEGSQPGIDIDRLIVQGITLCNW
ncbi:MAG: hypothetical protein ABWX95_01710 [Methyloceanibacter sp.]